MTEDYKKILLDYITTLTPGSATTGEIFESINEVARSKWKPFLPDGWQDFKLGGIIKSNTSDVNIFYGGYVVKDGTYEDDSKGIIIVTDNLLNPIQTLYQYDSGTDLRPITCMIQEEDGQFVATDSTTLYRNRPAERGLFYNSQKRFIMLNDISIPNDNVYYVKLRTSYILGANYTNFYCRTMFKNPNSSHYWMAGVKFDNVESTPNYNPAFSKVIDLKINVGSPNEWNTDETATGNIYGGAYCHFDSSDNAQWKLIMSPNNQSNNNIGYWYGTNGTATGFYTMINPGYKTYVDSLTYLNQCVFLNENVAYFVLNNQRWGYSGTPEAKYIGLYSYNFLTNTLNQIYLESLGSYDFCDLALIQLYAVNGEVYIEYVNNIQQEAGSVDATADYYVQRYEGTWNPILVKEGGGYVYVNFHRAFYVSQDFNLLKIYCYPINLRTATWNMLDITEVYSLTNYNGEPYENYNSLIGDYGNVYSNGELVFSRDLYNSSITNNYSVSVVEIPNTYLNGITLTPKDLIGKTNTQLVSDLSGINKNIYEVLFLNFINTINVIDNEDDIISGSSNYINQNINTGTALNQSNSNCSQVYITWSDNTTKTFSINWTRTDDTHCYTEFTLYIQQNIKSLELMSNDLTTPYIEIDTSNLETGKFYTITQYLKVE